MRKLTARKNRLKMHCRNVMHARVELDVVFGVDVVAFDIANRVDVLAKETTLVFVEFLGHELHLKQQY